MENNKLQKLHKVQVEILDEVVRICDENKINYFLASGTMLGAVRHKGFIPWDDDIDICMVREDYDKFRKIANEKLNSKYIMQCYDNDETAYFPFLKVRKKGTLFNEKQIEHYETNKGIFIDIFPLERFNNINSKIILIRAILIKNIWDTCLYKIGTNKTLKDCRHPVLAWFLNLRSRKSLEKWLMNLLSKIHEKDGKYVGDFVGAYHYRQDSFLYSKLFPLKKIKFENKEYKCVKDPDYYLRTLYGEDYMELPSVEKRVTHLPVEIKFGEKNEK